jgi:hypothetical protein
LRKSKRTVFQRIYSEMRVSLSPTAVKTPEKAPRVSRSPRSSPGTPGNGRPKFRLRSSIDDDDAEMLTAEIIANSPQQILLEGNISRGRFDGPLDTHFYRGEPDDSAFDDDVLLDRPQLFPAEPPCSIPSVNINEIIYMSLVKQLSHVVTSAQRFTVSIFYLFAQFV